MIRRSLWHSWKRNTFTLCLFDSKCLLLRGCVLYMWLITSSSLHVAPLLILWRKLGNCFLFEWGISAERAVIVLLACGLTHDFQHVPFWLSCQSLSQLNVIIVFHKGIRQLLGTCCSSFLPRRISYLALSQFWIRFKATAKRLSVLCKLSGATTCLLLSSLVDPSRVKMIDSLLVPYSRASTSEACHQFRILVKWILLAQCVCKLVWRSLVCIHAYLFL